MVIKQRVEEIIKYRVNVTQQHIDDGVCRLQHKCMEKVANAEALINLGYGESDAQLRVRVDAGHIRFNTQGYRWIADTPKKAKISLFKFDKNKQLVKPHQYTVTARRSTKIVKIARTKQEQINKARRDRIARGNKDPKYSHLRERLVGYTG